MSNKKSLLPPTKSVEPIAYRAVEFHAAEEGDAERSVRITLTTSEGVDVYDWKRGMIKEYLLMSGAKLPAQSPLVDSHNHESVRNILGSIRDFKIVGNRLKGRAYFASKPGAVEAYQDVKEGHLTDISVGFWRLKERYIEADKEEEVEGKTIKGPARIVTRWQPFEGSAVTVGADRHSTFGSVPALRAYLDPTGLQEEAMNENYRKLLVSLGMPAEMDDDAALAWAERNLAKKEEPKPVAPVAPVETRAAVVAPPVKEADPAELARVQLESAKSERARVTGILAACRKHNVAEKEASAMIDEGLTVDAASKRILDAQKPNPEGKTLGRIETTQGHLDGFRAAALDGVSLRIGANIEKPAPGAKDFRNFRILDLARRALKEEGVNVGMLSDHDVARRGFALDSDAGFRASDGQAYLTTGSLSNLLLDASHKTLLKAYTDKVLSYQSWVRQGESVPDFKNINRIRLGEIGNQPTVEENGDYKDMSISDSKESYRVEKRGSIISLTWEALRNDDLGGFASIVQKQGSAMKRTINRSVYQILFDNPDLSDGVALFHASSHGANLVTTDLSVTNLNAAYSAMMLQTGLNGDVILGVEPKYLIVAPALAGTAWQLLNSTADPAAGGSAVGNAGNANMYGPGGVRKLELIIEPLLAGNDANSWYLVADPMDVDSLELSFLQGEETPVFEQETAFIQDAVKYKVRQTWGVKALDYRGLFKSTGSS